MLISILLTKALGLVQVYHFPGVVLGPPEVTGGGCILRLWPRPFISCPLSSAAGPSPATQWLGQRRGTRSGRALPAGRRASLAGGEP